MTRKERGTIKTEIEKDNIVVTETIMEAKTTTITGAGTTTITEVMVAMAVEAMAVAMTDLNKEDITMVTIIIWAITIITTIKTNIILLLRMMIESQSPLLILNLKNPKKPRKENL